MVPDAQRLRNLEESARVTMGELPSLLCARRAPYRRVLVVAVARLAPPVAGLVEIGMWVILMTLIVAPPLTPWVARRLGVAE
jgi:hypothetical protein